MVISEMVHCVVFMYVQFNDGNFCNGALYSCIYAHFNVGSFFKVALYLMCMYTSQSSPT